MTGGLTRLTRVNSSGDTSAGPTGPKRNKRAYPGHMEHVSVSVDSQSRQCLDGGEGVGAEGIGQAKVYRPDMEHAVTPPIMGQIA